MHRLDRAGRQTAALSAKPMIAMPYIVVDMVLALLSLIFFCVTSAALLSKYPSANLYLPVRLRRRPLAFVAHGFVLSVLSIVVVLAWARLRDVHPFSTFIPDLLFLIALVNSIVLAYQLLNRRCFLSMPTVRRQLLIAVLSVVMTTVPALAVIMAVIGLFVIR